MLQINFRLVSISVQTSALKASSSAVVSALLTNSRITIIETGLSDRYDLLLRTAISPHRDSNEKWTHYLLLHKNRVIWSQTRENLQPFTAKIRSSFFSDHKHTSLVHGFLILSSFRLYCSPSNQFAKVFSGARTLVNHNISMTSSYQSIKYGIKRLHVDICIALLVLI